MILMMQIVKDQGGQGKQIDGNGKTSGEVNNLIFVFFSILLCHISTDWELIEDDVSLCVD